MLFAWSSIQESPVSLVQTETQRYQPKLCFASCQLKGHHAVMQRVLHHTASGSIGLNVWDSHILCLRGTPWAAVLCCAAPAGDAALVEALGVASTGVGERVSGSRR